MSGVITRRSLLRGAAAFAFAGSGGMTLASCGAPLLKNDALETVSGCGGSADEAYWSMVRRCFLLDETITHMNNGTLGPMPAFVLEGLVRRFKQLAADPNCYHTSGENMYTLFEKAREKAAALVNALPDEIAFTRNTTEGMSIIAAGFPMKPGDEVLMTDHEHVGGTACWERKAALEGVVIKKAALPSNPESEEEIFRCFEREMTERTRLLSVSHVTCTTGMRLPIKALCRMAHDKGIPVCVDGAQTLGWMKVDVKDLDCDFYANSPHKWLLSPIGTGFLYVKKQHIDAITPCICSGGWNEKGKAKKFESFGTRNLPEAIAVGDSIDFVNSIGMERIERRDYMLAKRLRQGLASIEGVTVLSPLEESVASPLTTVLLKSKNGTPLDLDAAYHAYFEKHKIRVRLVREAGLDAFRFSTHVYNGLGCIDKVVEATENLVRHG